MARPGPPPTNRVCRVFGHHWDFTPEGREVVWRCIRGCGEGGRRTYEDAQEARRFAAAYSRGGPGGAAKLFVAMSGTLPRRRRREDG